MVKKTTAKQQRFTLKTNYILWTIIVLLLVIQGLSAWQIIKLREYADNDSGFTMSMLLRRAEEDRYKYPVIDVANNRVYVPEARIYLPLNETSRDLRYDIRRDSTGSQPREIYFSTSSIVGTQTDEQYVSCDKMAALSSSAQMGLNDAQKAGSIKPTKDGLDIIFENTDSTCWNQKWYTYAKQSLIDTIKEAKNY